ncbi:MAG: hypothetical protein JNK49_03305 [Planctomycetes bacterium]|nr:hypothetical protein [Planctomycetota bacterium]
MSSPKSKSPGRARRLLRTLAIVLSALVLFLGLFVVAFVFNPFEGRLPEVLDAVPRDVNFCVRKAELAYDFADFPEPHCWRDLSEARGFPELLDGPLVRGLRRDGLDQALRQLRELHERVRADSQGWVDILRDLVGSEVVVAGFEQDYSRQPPQPLATPHWCAYTRVSWRIKLALGVVGLGLGRAQLEQGGITITDDGGFWAVRLAGQPEPLFVRRHLDLLMVGNHKRLLERSVALIEGSRDDEPLGKTAAYTEGVQKRLDRLAQVGNGDRPNAVEFLVEPNAFDGFRRHAASWPNAGNPDSMNERVLASFLNLKGWMQAAGSLVFGEQSLATTGRVVLSSKQHTAFQSSFYQAEKQNRQAWLDPFLRMVPEDACAAAALRMPAGEFLRAMFDALEPAARDLVNDGMRRCTLRGEQLTGTEDLIERIKPAFLQRTGFVFRRNKPDLSRDPATGELYVPVSARSPMPQVAWVFWLRPGTNKLLEDFGNMLLEQYGNFGFRKAWKLPVPFGNTKLPEPVVEFCNPMIPATGEIAMIVFSDFFVISNSGPLIKDILRTRYRADGLRSVAELDDYSEFVERELPAELNGLVWLRGANLVPVVDDFVKFAEADSEIADAEWLVANRSTAEDHVRRTQFARYPSKASMPASLTQPGGEFDNAVRARLDEMWKLQRSNFTADDRAKMLQLRAFASLCRTAYLQVELENNYIWFQGKAVGNLR